MSKKSVCGATASCRAGAEVELIYVTTVELRQDTRVKTKHLVERKAERPGDAVLAAMFKIERQLHG